MTNIHMKTLKGKRKYTEAILVNNGQEFSETIESYQAL